MKVILIAADEASALAELYDTPTAEAIWNALPIEGEANRWGDEIYFQIPVSLKREAGSSSDVEVGDIGYWPPGHAFCIFFGATPASMGDRPRAASPVNVFGRVRGDATVFKNVEDGAGIHISRSETEKD